MRMIIVALLLPLLVAGAIATSTLTGGSLRNPPRGHLSHEKAGSAALHLKHPERKPFLPFSDLGAPAGPPRRDGTFRDRVPEDTLPARLMDPYTTLDKLKKKGTKQGLKRGPFKKLKGALGGLNPDEVFYADEDMIIIKGGGFRGEPYDDPLRAKATRGFLLPALSLKRPPTVSAEYNGNTPTIIPAPPVAASRFSTLSLFFPSAAPLDTEPFTPGIPENFSKGLGTRLNFVYVILPEMRTPRPVQEPLPNNNLQLQVEVTASAPFKQPPPNLQPQIFISRGILLNHPLISPPAVLPLETPMVEAPPQQRPIQQTSQRLISSGSPSNLPSSFLVETLPETMTPAPVKQPSPQPNPEVFLSSKEIDVVQIGHSLAGDTNVNELFPRPPINPDAEIIPAWPQSPEVTIPRAQSFQRLTNPDAEVIPEMLRGQSFQRLTNPDVEIIPERLQGQSFQRLTNPDVEIFPAGPRNPTVTTLKEQSFQKLWNPIRSSAVRRIPK